MLVTVLAIFWGLLLICGWGELLRRALNRRAEVLQANFTETALLGFFALMLLGMALHLISPLNIAWRLGVSLGGPVGLLFYFKRWRPWSVARKLQLLAAISLGVLVVAVPTFATAVTYDTGLYHLQNILWHQQDPLVVGLANLHGRLGFNSSWLTLAALTALPGLDYASVFALNTVFLFITLLWISETLLTPTNLTSPLAKIYLWGVLLFFATFGKRLLYLNLGSPSTDLPAGLFLVVAVYYALAASYRHSSVYLLLLSTMAFSVKLTQLVPAALMILTRRKQILSQARTGWRRLPVLLLTTFLLLWTLRGLLSSGCLLYPLSGSCVGALPWTTTVEQQQQESDWVTAWARAPRQPAAEVLSNWHWLARWSQRLLKEDLAVGVVVFVFLGLGLWGFSRLKPRLGSNQDRPAGAGEILCALGLSASVWFWKTPDLRFGYGILIALAATSLAYGINQHLFVKTFLSRWQRPIMALCLLALALPELGRAGLYLVRYPKEAWPVFPVDQTRHLKTSKTQRTWQGVDIWVPNQSDQCWDLPRPCTPFFDPKISVGRLGPWPTLTLPR